MDPVTYNDGRARPTLEERLESIISGAALMADSSCTREDRRERIIQECNAVRQALQELLNEYIGNVSAALVLTASCLFVSLHISLLCFWYFMFVAISILLLICSSVLLNFCAD